ncbi:MAG TPA: DNA-formamidopyrimidine glycosylase family protein [Actinomycetota bacterium]|nr:DNA-formamidopyrimidine glycosylase family protein [Actinomycetota bacterium]
MPEGDTVHAAAARLNAALAGRRLTRTDFRVPAFAASDLSGQVLVEVVPRGKHLLFRTDAGITLHTHFKMDGEWRLHRPGERWRGPAHEIRAVLETERRVAVGVRMGVVELLPTREEHRVVGHLGPAVLGPDWDPGEVLRRLRERPERAIGEALIDQRVIAGPGNVYKSEVCFLRGVDPWTAVGAVADLGAMIGLIARLMEANRTTGRQTTTGDTRRGRGRWVYGRAGLPCLRCGSPIRRGEQGGPAEERVTYWCPSCQPPAACRGCG